MVKLAKVVNWDRLRRSIWLNLRKAKQLLALQSRYAHARWMKRAKKYTRTLRTYLGRVIRNIERKCPEPDQQTGSFAEYQHPNS